MRHCQNCNRSYDDRVLYCPRCARPTAAEMGTNPEAARRTKRLIFWIPGVVMAAAAIIIGGFMLTHLPQSFILLPLVLFFAILYNMFFVLAHTPRISPTVIFMQKTISKKRFVLFALFCAIIVAGLFPAERFRTEGTPQTASSVITEPQPSTAPETTVPAMQEEVSSPAATAPQAEAIPQPTPAASALLADMTQFAGLTPEELTALLGPETAYTTQTIQGVHDFAGEIYMYAPVGQFNAVAFVLIDGKVVYAVSIDNSLPLFATYEERLAAIGIASPNPVSGKSDAAYLYYTFPSDKIDEVEFSGISAVSGTFSDIFITYDRSFFSRWPLPLTEAELDYYVPLTEKILSDTLAPGGGMLQFPPEHTYWGKNSTHLFVDMDGFDASGNRLYPAACCFYEIATSELVGILLGDEALWDPKGVMAEHGF